MAPVGCRIDQDIVRSCFHTALDHSLQIFVLNFKFLKGKVIHINDKLIVPVLDICDHRRKILELVLVNLDHAKAIIIILIDDRFDTGRLAGTAVTKEQHIVGSFSLYKGFGILHKLLFLDLIAHKIRKHDRIHIVDRTEKNTALRLFLNTECLVQTKHANSIILIKAGDHIEKFLFITGLLQLPA